MSDHLGQSETSRATTLVYLDGKPVYLDEPYGEGGRVHVRADFDDPNSAWQGTYELAREGERWVLR